MIRRSLVALLTLAALAACGDTPRAPDAAGGPAGAGVSSGPPCVPAGAAGSPAAAPTGAPVAAARPDLALPDLALPDLALPCLVGGAQTRLTRFGRPAVINLWASWCGPCRTELPALQRFAELAGDAVLVVGVDSRDRRADAESLVGELGLTFPMLYDREAELMRGVNRVALPVTLFVDAGGRLVHLHAAGVLDLVGIGSLVGRHLGVVVPL